MGDEHRRAIASHAINRPIVTANAEMLLLKSALEGRRPRIEILTAAAAHRTTPDRKSHQKKGG